MSEGVVFEILVVDDEADICWALERALRDAGFRVTPVTGGVGAIREVTARRFDAALIDVKLPGTSGFAVSQQIRRLDPRLKVVLISGYHYADDQPIQAVIRHGECQGFISKPFDLDQVSALLQRVIEQDRASLRPEPSPLSSGGTLERR